MRRILVIVLAVAIIAAGAWFVLRDDGLLEQVTAERVEDALMANGMPAPMARCMSERLVDRLTIEQLRKLERLAPQEGEAGLPGSIGAVLERLERVDDPQAIEALASSAANCGMELLRERF